MKQATRKIVLSAAVAALYAVLSYFGNIFGLTYGPVQIRLSEALCVLPFLMPETAPGLFVGCLLANLLRPYGVPDIVFGSLATLIAAVATAKVKKRWLAPLPPVIANGVIIGALISWYEVGFGAGFLGLFAVTGAWVAFGEAVACYVLGGLLLQFLPRSPFFRRMMPEKKLEYLDRTDPKNRKNHS